MKILIFLHGTLIMHKSAEGKTREERVRQVLDNDPSVHDYISYIPVNNAVEKLKSWQDQGAKILYLSSHERIEDVEKNIFSFLKKIGRAQIRKARNIFLWCPPSSPAGRRGGGGAEFERTILVKAITHSARELSFVLKIGSNLIQ